jgi:hypothetical protein
MARQEVASRHALSLRRLDTVLRQALRHCAEKARPQALQGGRAFEAPCAAPKP